MDVLDIFEIFVIIDIIQYVISYISFIFLLPRGIKRTQLLIIREDWHFVNIFLEKMSNPVIPPHHWTTDNPMAKEKNLFLPSEGKGNRG